MAERRVRVDVLLVDRGVFDSRAKAAAAILAGDVQLKNGGRRINKPGQTVPDDIELIVAERNRYVSRGGIKLENALEGMPLPLHPGAARYFKEKGLKVGS